MCLGVPGMVVEVGSGNDDQLARVDVSGVRRTVNVALLEDEGLAVGDWVVIHVGFAMAKIDEEEARRALEGLQLMGEASADGLDGLSGR